MRGRLGVVALLSCLAALAGGASAQAATKTVIAGAAGTAKGVFGPTSVAEVDQFSLPQVTIHVGDKVRWVFRGFHDVVFPVQTNGHAPDVPLIVLDPTAVYQGFKDAAGNPFWFNGQRQLDLNPAAAFPQGGKTEDGTTLTSSGLPLGAGAQAPFILTFNKAGVFQYECAVHAGMDGTVRVVPRNKPIPSARADARAAARLLAAQARIAKRELRYHPPKNTVSAGHDLGSQIALDSFFPKTLRIHVGTTVTFVVASRSETHTFSFGPSAYLNGIANAFVIPILNKTGPPTLQFNPLLNFPSLPPPLPPYDGTGHGNGYLNTGVMDTNPATPGPSRLRIKFTKAGTYRFICLIHPFMHGAIIVRK